MNFNIGGIIMLFVGLIIICASVVMNLFFKYSITFMKTLTIIGTALYIAGALMMAFQYKKEKRQNGR